MGGGAKMIGQYRCEADGLMRREGPNLKLRIHLASVAATVIEGFPRPKSDVSLTEGIALLMFEKKVSHGSPPMDNKVKLKWVAGELDSHKVNEKCGHRGRMENAIHVTNKRPIIV